MSRQAAWRRALVPAAWVAGGMGATALLAVRLRDGTAKPTILAATVLVVGLLLLPVILLSYDGVVTRLRQAVDGRPMTTLVVAAVPIFPYLLYWRVAAGSTGQSLAAVVLYVGTAALLACVPLRGRSPGWADLAVVLAVWLPLEFRWLNRSFPWPEGGSGRILGGLMGLDLLLFLLLVARRYDGMGYSVRLRRGDIVTGALAWAAFIVVGIPIGLLTGFIGPPHPPPGLLAVPLAVVTVFLFTGLQEETLFRGVFQGFLQRWIGRPIPALLSASLFFGLVHLNNGPAPDWRYALMATLAGVAYGLAYSWTGRVAAAAVAHTLVDATWVLFFK